MGGTGSCKQITNKYGNSAAHYNMNTIKVAKAVHKETQCPLCVRESGEMNIGRCYSMEELWKTVMKAYLVIR